MTENNRRARSRRLRKLTVAFCAFSALAATSTARAADTGGVVLGRVVDTATKKPLANAEVTVTSPSLQTPQVVKTDASGFYRVPNLPPGDYYIQFDKEGYLSNGLSDIAMRAASTLRLDAPLTEGSVQSISLISKPNVDIGSSSTGTSLSSDFIRRVPLSAPGGKGAASRSIESIAEIAPGASADSNGTSINGSSSPENSYNVDGLSVGNPAKGTLGTQLSGEFVDEVNVVTGGYLPEYGRTTGGVLNVTTKSGSNEFHGSVFSYFSPGSLEGRRAFIKPAAQPVQYRQRLSYIGDLGFDLGGPIVKDRLWFYTGFDISDSVYDLDRGIYRTDGGTDASGSPSYEAVPISSQAYQAKGRTYQGIAKLTFAADADNRFSLSVLGSPYRSGGGATFDPANNRVTGGTYDIDPLTGRPSYLGATPGSYAATGRQQISTPIDVNAKWNAEFLGKRLLLDVTTGLHYQFDAQRAVDGSGADSGPGGLGGYYEVVWNRNTPGLHSIGEFETLPSGANCTVGGVDRCLVGSYNTNAPEQLQDATYHRYHTSVILSYLANAFGHHVLKAGFDGELLQFQNVKSNRQLSESADGTYFSDSGRFGTQIGPDVPVLLETLRKKTESVVLGGFLQDSWSVFDKVTVNAGLRYDVQYFMKDGVTQLSLPNQWSPRLGLIFDPSQTGRAKIFATYARYYQSTPLDFSDVALAGEPQLLARHAGAPTCNPANYRDQLGACKTAIAGDASLPNKLYNDSGGGNAIDPSIQASSIDEASGGSEYEVLSDARVGLSYTRRWIHRWIEDMSSNYGLPAFDANPGYGLGAAFPAIKRDYDAATLYFMKAFSHSWLAQASYTLAYLRGNYTGFIQAEDNYLAVSQSTAYDTPYVETNRSGRLPGDTRHSVKIVTSKEWALAEGHSLTTGVVLRAQSGGPTSYLGRDPKTLYDGQIYILPRGSGRELPWTYGADFQLAYRLAVGKTAALSATIDVFNVFNLQAATQTDQTYTRNTVYAQEGATKADLDQGKLKDTAGNPLNDPQLVSPSFGQAIRYQEPRIFRFGLRGQF